ncbi:Tfp pilus assembly protein PilF [Nitrospirillum amazonense]|uniref:Tfp pilus assembly protein PilF n=1 Tax=Nitrospirillum amazonense TaxID=28077 RepID=A0A560FKG8_9PROT|nr:tetratricopeptide repeat protein [Nitrospirillum amazonense]TWB22088.1 Tfp pilus assembly protein PilF [Nitrospirillum amazonense]
MPTVGEVLAVALDHHQSGRLDQAEDLYGQILRAMPDCADALHLQGVLFVQTGRAAAGEGLIAQAIALDGGNIDYRANLAQAQRQRGDQGAALTTYGEVVALAPRHGPAHLARAQILEELGRVEAAADAYRLLTGLPHQQAEAQLGLGRCLLRLDRKEEAEAAFRAVLALAPDEVVALVNLGDLLRQRGGHEAEAARLLDHALRLRPGLFEAAASRAELHATTGEMAAAAEMARGLIAAHPGRPEPYGILARALRYQGYTADALKVGARQLALAPDDPEVAMSLAHCHLRLGDFRAGFPLYRRRWHLTPLPRRHQAVPEWDGRALPGKNLVVWDEQGAGDTISMLRLLPQAAARVGRLVFESPHALSVLWPPALWPGQQPGDVVLRGRPLPLAPDCQIAMMELPEALGLTVDTIPWNGPYLEATPERVAAWRARLADVPGRRVGLLWAGNPQFPVDAWRSPGLAALLPLLEAHPDVTFIGLQRPEGRGAVDGLTLPPNLLDLAPEVRDWADTAAIMTLLDLVITPDTGPAHVAGALGRPVWTMVITDADWRWMDQRADTPWYPSMRLFRQATLGEWAPVVAAMSTALATFQGDRAS